MDIGTRVDQIVHQLRSGLDRTPHRPFHANADPLPPIHDILFEETALRQETLHSSPDIPHHSNPPPRQRTLLGNCFAMSATDIERFFVVDIT